MAIFENPANGYREEVTGASGVWAFLFGLFYFLVKGAWTHAVIQIVLIIASIAILGAGGIAVMFLVWIGYAFAAPGILEARYRRLGWREVGPNFPSSGHLNIERQGHSAALPATADTRECPRCAETIKAAAKVCRFCGAELSPEANPQRAHLGAVAATIPSFPGEGGSVTHKSFGVGFVVRRTEPGKVLVRFETGHQEVMEADLSDIT